MTTLIGVRFFVGSRFRDRPVRTVAALKTARFPWRLLELGRDLSRHCRSDLARVLSASFHAARRDRRGAPPPARESAGAADLTPSAQVQELHDRCRRHLLAGTQTLLVDLSSVTGADTKLVASLVVLKRQAHASGRTVEIVCSERVRDWLRVYRLESLIDPATGQSRPAAPPPPLRLDARPTDCSESLAAAG